MKDNLDENFLQKNLYTDILLNNNSSKEIKFSQPNINKFNVEKYEQKKFTFNKNTTKFCDRCNNIINSFSLNEKYIRLLFNQQKKPFIFQNIDSSIINELLIKLNLCSNCLKITLDKYYFKQKDLNNIYINNTNLDEIDKEMWDLLQVFENLDEEKLNINIRLYHSYKKLINSYIEYIKDNNNKNEDNSFNIKNFKIIGIDSILNVIDLLNKNISIIKEKNSIKKKFLEEINNEKNDLIKEIKNNNINRYYLKTNNEIIRDEVRGNENKNKDNSFNFIKNDWSKDNKNEISINNNENPKNNQNLFKTKIIKSKKKFKKLKRISRKIKFIVKIK